MKIKYVSSIVILLMLGYCAYGQDKYSLGVKGGMNYATIAGDAEGVKPRLGYHIGVFGQGAISEVFHFGTELQFTSQGAQTDDDPTFKIKYDYLTLAFLFKVYPVAHQSKFNLHLGPQFGYLLSAEVDTENVKDE